MLTERTGLYVVAVPPEINVESVLLDQNVVRGRPAVLNCPATGIPFPDIAWYKVIKIWMQVDEFEPKLTVRVSILTMHEEMG